jgi:hypothetical protein
MRVRDALEAYLNENGFTKEAYESARTSGSFLGKKFAVPNPPTHRRAIRLHDLHHVATGFGTDHAGEGELSAWQARRGLRGVGAYVAAIVLMNTSVGLLVAPRRTWNAFVAAGSGRSLFDRGIEYESLLDRSVGELRALLGVPERGIASDPRQLHAHAPSSQSPLRESA